MKKIAKRFVVTVLWWQVKRLRKKHNIKIVAVAGSIGKTSTKFAVAEVLKQKYRVRFQEGNYNDIVSVPLIFFGLDMPSLLNPIAWVIIFWRAEQQIKKYPFDIVMLEIGTDAPGQIAAFGKYLWVDHAILTAITPEHMQYFADIDAVAWEELAIAKFSQHLLINSDLVHPKYIRQISQGKVETYSIKESSTYQIINVRFIDKEHKFDITKNGQLLLHSNHSSISEPQLYSIAAAIAMADKLGLSVDEILEAVQRIEPVNGRMKQLDGINDSLIIDDTYNSSPEAAKAALQTLYRLPASQKIAILGNMNELGKYSAHAHSEIGELCDPKEVDLVVTIGKDANKYLAAAAEKRGCQVKRFDGPFEAGIELKDLIRPKAVILAKGSQNGVFAEEVVKSILAHPTDVKNLVRQSPSWMKVKRQQFGLGR